MKADFYRNAIMALIRLAKKRGHTVTMEGNGGIVRIDCDDGSSVDFTEPLVFTDTAKEKF